MHNWISLLLLVLIPMPGFLWRIRVEERALAERFGADFAEIRAGGWALLPLIW